MIKKHFKKLSFTVIALMTIAAYTMSVTAKPEFKPYVAERGAYDGGLVSYDLYKNEAHFFMRIQVDSERGVTLFKLLNLNTGDTLEYEVKRHEEIIQVHQLTPVPYIEKNSVAGLKVHKLGNHELMTLPGHFGCSPIGAGYYFKDSKNNTSAHKSLIVIGDLVYGYGCDITYEWGPIPVVSRSLEVSRVWALNDDVYVVTFNKHPAILYIDKSMGFDNPLNTGVNFTIVDHQVIETILNDEKLEQNSYKKRLSLPKPLTDKTKKELLTLLTPAYTAQALKEHLENIKKNNKGK